LRPDRADGYLRFGKEALEQMYATDVVWWGYTAIIAAIAVFMLYFAGKIRSRGE
jgi:hypothetical protein